MFNARGHEPSRAAILYPTVYSCQIFMESWKGNPLLQQCHTHTEPSGWKFSQAEASDEKETAQAYREAFLQVAGKPTRKTKERHVLAGAKKKILFE